MAGSATAQRVKKTVPDSLNGCSFPARMQNLANELTDKENEVGAYFLGNPGAAYMSITDVVGASGLGYGTVIRFCRKLGCAGFQEFKVLLAQELRVPVLEDGAESGDWVAQHAVKIRSELAHTEKLLDRDTTRSVAATLDKAGRVLVAGIAGSASPAVGFDYRLSRIGVHSESICDGYNLTIRAACLSSDDVLLAVSFSGATKDLLAAAQVAKENGATVVSLTNFIHAPLVDLADLSLFSVTDRDPMSCEVFSNISSNFVLDVVFSELYRLRPDAGRTVERTFKAISDRRV